ncbi:MAG: hypothetical protein ABIJ27_07525 [Candidatus Omnitrophota bacterium]
MPEGSSKKVPEGVREMIPKVKAKRLGGDHIAAPPDRRIIR